MIAKKEKLNYRRLTTNSFVGNNSIKKITERRKVR